MNKTEQKLQHALLMLQKIRERCSGYYLIEKTEGMTSEDVLRKEIEIYREHRGKCWKDIHDFFTYWRIQEPQPPTSEGER